MKRKELIELLSSIEIYEGKIDYFSCERIADFVQKELFNARDREEVKKNNQKKLDKNTE